MSNFVNILFLTVQCFPRGKFSHNETVDLFLFEKNDNIWYDIISQRKLLSQKNRQINLTQTEMLRNKENYIKEKKYYFRIRNSIKFLT